MRLKVKFREVYNISSPDDGMYVLVAPDGSEIPAVLVDEVMTFNATANDIREGKLAATDMGVTTGAKVIPSYYVNEGFRAVPNGSRFIIPVPEWDYTKLQAIICSFNTTLYNSVSAEKVTINNKIYDALSTTEVSTVVKDSDNARVDFGIFNDTGRLCLIRYFMYKEIY